MTINLQFLKINQTYRSKTLKLGLIMFLILLVLVLYKLFFQSIWIDNYKSSYPSSIVHYQDISQMDTSEFFTNLKKADNNKIPFVNQISGIIIPHHLLAGHLILNVFQKVPSTNLEDIVLITPNHYEHGDKAFITSNNNWKTPFGNIYPDLKLIDILNYDSNFVINNPVVFSEHAVTGTLPYLNYYYPEIKVTPVIISAFANEQQLTNFSRKIFNNVDNKTLFILSLDFSHYLNSNQSDVKDEISLKAIKDFDFAKIANFNNDYVDSPTALILFLKIMQLRDTQNVEVVDHTNSGVLTNNKHIENTSYFTIGFY